MIICDGVAIDDAVLPVKPPLLAVPVDSASRISRPYFLLLPCTSFFSEVTRKVRLDLRIVTTDDDVIYELPPTMVDATDPLYTLEFDPRFTDVNIEKAGDYFIRLLADGVYIMDVRFTVWLNDEDDA